MNDRESPSRPWLASYPRGVPATINPDQYPSLKHLLERSLARYAAQPAYISMGRTLRYSDLDRMSAHLAAWLQQVAPAKETVRHALDELGPCRWIDFREWIDQRVPKVVPALAAAVAEVKEDLEGELEEMLGGQREFTASDLKQIVRKINRKGR